MKLSRLYSREWFLVSLCFVLILFLLSLFVPRASEQADAMEQRRFDLRLAELNAALRLKSMELLARSESSKIEEGMNPFVWLDYYDPNERPEVIRYLGEVPASKAKDPKRMWIYDPERKAIGYMAGANLSVQGEQMVEGEWIWFQVRTQGANGAGIWQLSLIE